LLFDAGGTVFDWRSPVVDALAQTAAGREVSNAALQATALSCRGHFLGLNGKVIRGDRPWQNADATYCEAIGLSCAEAGLSGLSDAEWRSVFLAWRNMPAWAGARDAIATLRRKFIIAPLTVLSWSMVVGSSRASGIIWDSVLSCDLLGVYKPDPKCFTRATEIVGCDPGEIMMVASHPSDVRAGVKAGYRSAYIRPRLFDPDEDYADTGFADFTDLAAKLEPKMNLL
jgi:2-haloacid dehalogenase